MTLTVGSHFQSNPVQFERRVWDEPARSETVEFQEGGLSYGVGAPSAFDANKCQVLLNDPAIGLWAAEAASEYGVSVGDALELLAYALFLDGEK